MPSGSFKKAFVFLMLGLLTLSAFFIRLENFKQSQLRTIDEVVYYRMAKQVLNEGISGYHTIPYGEDLAASGRPLPDYFFQPLFIHPPFFTLMNSFSMRLFGESLVSCGFVSILFGVLLIPLVYMLGFLLFDHKIALLSAIFMWLDPVNIISSQKVWMDTTLAFWCVLSVYLFALAQIKKYDLVYLFSGIACGLAMLTKYTGILSWIIILLYAAAYNKKLFKNKYLIGSLFIPGIMLLPWLIRNFQVFGADFVLMQFNIHHISFDSTRMKVFVVTFLVVILGFFWKRFRSLGDQRGEFQKSSLQNHFRLRRPFMIACAALLMIGVFPSVVRSLTFNHLPTTSWYQGLFALELPTFYFGRLIEWSALFILSFAAFFIHVEDNKDRKYILLISSLVILVFFMVWRNYQSRYILLSIPFLIILGVNFWLALLEKANHLSNSFLRSTIRLSLQGFLIYAIVKTHSINLLLSYSNDMCYF